MRSLMKKTVSLFILVGVLTGLFPVYEIQAASLTYASDAMTRHLAGSASDHEIVFATPTGVESSSDTIEISLNGFDFSSIALSDISLSHGPSTGLETIEVLQAAAGIGVWGLGIAGSVMTLTPPTNAALNEIAPADVVRIRIGTNAGGTNQIINPSAAGGYQGIIRGGFGDTGAFGLVVVESDQVAVTAEVRSGTQGGHSQPTTDTIPPTIVNVVSTSTSPTSALIQWITSEASTSHVDFGQTIEYASGTVSNTDQTYQHSVNLTDLEPCTEYYYQVRSSDGSGNQAISSGYSFTTVCDTQGPIITNVRVEQVTDSGAVILWSTNEPASSRVEYGVAPEYGIFSETQDYVALHAMPISGLTANTVYTYRVVSTDVSGNTTVATGYQFVTNRDTTPPTNVMFTATPGDGYVILEWSAPIDADAAGVLIVRRLDRYPMGPGDGASVYAGMLTSVSDQSLQNDTTYYYGAYAYDEAGNYSSGALASATPRFGIIPPPDIPPEIPVTPTSTPPVIVPPVIPEIPGSTTTPPIIPGIPTPGAVMDIEFFGSNGTLPLVADEYGIIGTRGNAGITVRVPVSSMDGVPRYVVVLVGDFIVQLQLNRAKTAYEGTFSVSPNSELTVKGQVLFLDGRTAEKSVVFRGYAAGSVIQAPLYGVGMIPVPGAEIRLYREELGTWVLWNSAPFGQSNPQYTSEGGSYLFEVPEGRYYAEVRKEGYELRKTDPVYIDRHVFNQRIELIYIPKTLRELLESASSTNAFEKAGIIAGSLKEKFVYQVNRLRYVLSNPDIQDVNTQIIAPSALIISAFNAVAAVSVFQWLTYLQYLFTQPFLLIWRRKRMRHGVIYNSLTKMPMDLSIVRLIHGETGLIVQTQVTDRQGRYLFHVKPGVYRLEVLKPKFVFPSEHVTDQKSDDEYLDVYDGGEIKMKEDGLIAKNVPIDPIVKQETPRRVRVRKGLRLVQRGVARISIAASVIALIVTPTVPIALGVVSQLVIYSVFRRLMIPSEPKRWGFVYDAKSLKPVANAVIRLYDKKYGKLLDTQLTNAKGQYGFLVGKNVYSITVESRGYESSKVETVEVADTEASGVDVVVGLKKEGQRSVGKSPLVK